MNPALRVILEEVFAALRHAQILYGGNAPSADTPPLNAPRAPMTQLRRQWAQHHHAAIPTGWRSGNVGGGVSPGDKAAVARHIYEQARARGYSHHDATAIVAYAIGESGLNPTISGGVQGDGEVIGLFQEKAAFAVGGGVDPAARYTVEGNTTAYLNQLEDNRHLPIEQALPATSVGGPLASGPGSAPQEWGPLMARAAALIGAAG